MAPKLGVVMSKCNSWKTKRNDFQSTRGLSVYNELDWTEHNAQHTTLSYRVAWNKAHDYIVYCADQLS